MNGDATELQKLLHADDVVEKHAIFRMHGSKKDLNQKEKLGYQIHK